MLLEALVACAGVTLSAVATAIGVELRDAFVNAEGDLPAEAVADVFPAYDDDGGLLIVLTPES